MLSAHAHVTVSGGQNTQTPAQNAQRSFTDIKFISTDLLCRKYKVKQLTWSRGFTFPVLNGVRGVPDGQSLLTNSYK